MKLINKVNLCDTCEYHIFGCAGRENRNMFFNPNKKKDNIIYCEAHKKLKKKKSKPSYQKLASNTEPKDYTPAINKMSIQNIRLLHAAMGLCTESGEFQDALKKHLFYGSELDPTNLIEEVGDILWYCALACNVLNIPLKQVQNINIAKLKKRFPNLFNEEDAKNRDLKEERKVLERA